MIYGSLQFYLIILFERMESLSMQPFKGYTGLKPMTVIQWNK